MNIKRLFILTGTLLLGLTLVSMWLLLPSGPPESARAAGPWYVAPGGSDGNSCLSPGEPCATINGAIGKASGGDTIFVATGTYTGTGDEVVLINKDITLSGGWDGSFTAQSGISTIDGEESRRGITVNSVVAASVDYFTVQNGNTGGDGIGGGILNYGTITLTNVTINNNLARYGGGIHNYNGIATIIKSTIMNNLAYSISTYGGGISNGGTLFLEDTTISGNNATNGYGGGIYNGGSAYLKNVTITNNSVTIYSSDGYGGGLSNWGDVTIQNSIIAGNNDDDEPIHSDCHAITGGLIISNGYNLVGVVDGCNWVDATGDLTGTLASPLDPVIGLLQDNGGPTLTHALLPESPAIDSGSCPDFTADQRGYPRPVDILAISDVDDGCDIGAYEIQNLPPTINGAQSGQTVNDDTTIDPFTGVTITDPDYDNLTVIVSLDNANKGELTNLGGFVEGPSGTYTFDGSPSSATTAIQGLTFNPTENRKTPGSTDTTTFTISADDDYYDPVTDDTTTVIATSINDPPTIDGTVAGQTVDDDATIDPFSAVIIADPDKNASLTVVVSLDDPDKGTLTNLGGFVSGPAGTYTFAGTPTEATTAIQGMTFDPTENRVPVGDTETTTFTISADDGIIASPVTDDTTTIIATSINDPPTISGTVAGQTVDDNATIDPFTGVTIADPDVNATLTVTVTLDNADKGSLTNLGGFVEGPDGTYTFLGSPAASTTAIKGLTFIPTEGRVPEGQTETTTFTISADDGIADLVVDDATTVIVSPTGTTKKIFLPLVMK